MKSIAKISIFLVLLVQMGCAAKRSAGTEDPVAKTKVMLKEGHNRLYERGGMKIPLIDLPVIAPGPNVVELSSELMGYGAANLYIESIAGVANSYDIVWDGTKKSFVLAGDLWQTTAGAVGGIHKVTWQNSGKLMDVTYMCTAGLFYGSWQVAKGSANATYDAGKFISNTVNDTGKNLARNTRKVGVELIGATFTNVGVIYQANSESVGETYTAAGSRLLKYGSIHRQLGTHWSDYLSQIDAGNVGEAGREEWERRRLWTEGNLNLISTAFQQPGDKKSESFEKTVRINGVAFATLKQAGIILKSVFWNFTLKPVGKMVAGSLGLIGSNAVVYPALTIGRGAYETTKVAGKTVWQTARFVGEVSYEIVSPLVIATGQTVYASGQYVVGTTAAGVAGAMTPVGGAVVLTGGEVASLVVRGIGVSVGETVAYAGTPIVGGVVVASGAVASVTTGTIGTSVVAGNAVVGESAAGIAAISGGAASALAAVGGTAVAVVKGGGKAAYGMGKSVVLPVGSFASGGVLVSYATASQIAGQGILLASDAIYLLISLEGARWALYEIKS